MRERSTCTSSRTAVASSLPVGRVNGKTSYSIRTAASGLVIVKIVPFP